MLSMLSAVPRNAGHDVRVCSQVSCQSVRVLGHEAIAARALVRRTRPQIRKPSLARPSVKGAETIYPKP